MSYIFQAKDVDPTFQRLLSCLEQIRHKFDSHQDQVDIQFFGSRKDFWKFFEFHNNEKEKLHDEGKRAVDLADQVLAILIPLASTNKEIQELQHILMQPHFEGLLQAYDSIQAGDFSSVIFGIEPVLTDLGSEPQKEDFGQIISVEHHQGNAGGNDKSILSAEKTVATIVIDCVDCGVDSDHYLETKDVDEAEGNKIRNVVGNFTEKGNDDTDLLWLDTDEIDGNEIEVSENFADKKKDETGPLWLDRPTVPQTYATDHTLEVEEQSNNKETHIRDFPIATEIEKDRSDMAAASEKNGLKEKQLKEMECSIENGNRDGIMPQYSKSAVKTVILFRNSKETLGITVKAVHSDENKEKIIVARILSGGLADNFASLFEDDEILAINGRSVDRMTANQVAEVMDGITGSIEIKVLPANKDKKLTKETKVSLRAFFDYKPLQDPLIPCKEVGVAFKAGDVLHVVNMDDANWWQARKDGCNHDKAGLIPSKDFQERRQQLNRISSTNDVTAQKDKNGKLTSPFKKMKKKADSNKVLCNFLKDIPILAWPAYEPVAKYLQRPEKKRLLLLIGAPGVGRNELKKMLLSSSPERFITTVPHTSRHMKSYEADGKDYFFVSRQTMENFIQKRKFIEFGEYKGCLYGTSKDSITRAMKSRKTCVLKVQPEVMLLLRTAEFKPYCVFVKPPPVKELRTTRLTVQAKNKKASDKSSVRTFKEEELQEIISTSRMLEETYGRFFDLTIENKDIEEAYVSIVDTFENLEQEEQWVPLDWAQQH